VAVHNDAPVPRRHEPEVREGFTINDRRVKV
jgi:hypothetical protein